TIKTSTCPSCGSTQFAAGKRSCSSSRRASAVSSSRDISSRFYGRALLLLQPVVAVGLLRRTEAEGRRASPPGEARAETVRLPGRGAAHRRRAAAHASRAAPHLSRARARSLAQASRHAAQPRAETLSAGRQPARLEQTARLDGDRRAGARTGCAPAFACALARAMGGRAEH